MYIYGNFRCRFKKTMLETKNFFLYENPCFASKIYRTKKRHFKKTIFVTKILDKKIWHPQADSQPTGALSKRLSYFGGHIKKKIIGHFKVRALRFAETLFQPTVCNLFPLSDLPAFEMNCRQPEHATGVNICALISKRRSSIISKSSPAIETCFEERIHIETLSFQNIISKMGHISSRNDSRKA